METFDRWTLRLVSRRPERGLITTLGFEPLTPLTFTPGQWLHLACEAQPSDRDRVRHMSIASAPQDPWLEFTMDLGSGTPYKKAMAGLREGDVVAAFKLRGEFIVEPGASDPLVFIAGGLGITPIRSILRNLDATGSTVPRHLVHVARDFHLFADEFGRATFPQTRTDHRGWTAHRASLLASASPQTRFYVCGSERFLTGVVSDLQAAGVPTDRIRTEDFH